MEKKPSTYLVPVILFTLMTLGGMRYTTHALAYGLPAGILYGIMSFPQALLTDPLHIDFRSTAVQLSGALILAALLVGSFAMGYSARKRAKDTGREHGEERFATEKEMGAYTDKNELANNFWYTKHCGLVFKAQNARQEDAQYAMNFNMVCYGTSGQGKTLNEVKVSALQSVGKALEGKLCGWHCIVGHALASPVADTLRKLWTRPVQNICAFAHKLGKHEDASTRAKEIRNAFMQPFGAAARTCKRLKRVFEARRIIFDGYDFFNTDPKGDNLKDLGWLFEKADYAIKCFNTIDPAKSLHYNPFVYIKTRLVDIKDADDVSTSCRVVFEDGEVLADTFDGEVTATMNAPREGFVDVDIDIKKRIVTCEDEAQVNKQVKEDLIGIADRLGERLADVVKDFSYKRSAITIRVAYVNTDWKDHSPTIEVKLDPSIELTSHPKHGFAYDPQTNAITWQPGSVCGRAKENPDAVAPSVVLTLGAKMKSMRIADGIDLTKTINCLVKNLNEAVEATGDSKFWEDTKLLSFMSYVALQFEKYGPEYRNLPTTLKLLNMALVEDDPSALSELDVLMEAWETGFIYLPDEDDEDASASPRKKRKGGSWQLAGNDPHDRAHSMALHCYKAYNVGAVETRQSVLASCHAAFAKLLSEEIQELTSYDEMALDTLGEAGQKQVVFAVPQAVDDTYGFLFALMTFQAMSLFCERAVNKHAGRAPRHVRFEIDEAGTIGKITLLDRIIAVIRSFNGSIALYFQDKSQADKTYGEKEANIIIGNCASVLFMGSQSPETLAMVSDMLGEETVYGSTLQRTFDACGFVQGGSENVQGTARKLRSNAQLRRENKRKMIAFVYGLRPVLDYKFPTWEHPLYCYIDPGRKRKLTQPVCQFDRRFDYAEYLERQKRRKAARERGRKKGERIP